MTHSRGRRLAALAVLTLTVTGCGRYYWSRQGAALDDFNRDSAACAREASPAYGIVIQETYRRCLGGKGWVRGQHPEPAPSGWYRGIE